MAEKNYYDRNGCKDLYKRRACLGVGKNVDWVQRSFVRRVHDSMNQLGQTA